MQVSLLTVLCHNPEICIFLPIELLAKWKRKTKYFMVTLWSLVEVFHCWCVASVRKLFWYGKVWYLWIYCYLRASDQCSRKAHGWSCQWMSPPTVNYFQLHYNVISLAMYMQMYIMRYYKRVLTLLGLFCHVLKLKWLWQVRCWGYYLQRKCQQDFTLSSVLLSSCLILT